MSARKLQFTGAYFDGLTAQKHQATVHLSPRQMKMSLADSRTVEWDYADLRRRSHGANDTPPFNLECRIQEPEGHRLESLTVDDPEFLLNLRQVSAVSLHSSLQPATGWKTVALLVAVLVIPMFLYGMWKVVIPALSDRVAMQVPVAWEEKLGTAVLEGLPKSLAPVPHPQREKLLQAIINRLLPAGPDQPYNIRIYISPHKMVNAVALPGGHIVVFQGLLNAAESPEELAGVLAHEIQHVVLRHSTRAIIRAMTSKILLTMMLGDMNDSMEMALDVAGELDGLRHSRNMEREADRHGMDMILAAGIDPNGMVQMFEKLQAQEKVLPGGDKAEKSGSEEDKTQWTEYFSTHPAGKDRMSQLKKQVAMAGETSYTPLLPNVDWRETVHQKPSPEPGGI